MPIKSTTLRPGLLVALSTAITGNVDYAKRVIEEDHITESGARRAVWETEKVVTDAKELDEATTVRSAARALITGVCSRSDFGLLCPVAKREELDAAAEKARTICEDFNTTAKYTQISFFVLTAQIADDDVSAIRAINGEVRGLLDQMKVGIAGLDVEVVRAAAAKAKQLGTMLTPEAQERLEGAIKSVRSMATRMNKAGEQAAAEIDAASLQKLVEARTAFLDIDDAGEVIAPEDTTGRALDLTPRRRRSPRRRATPAQMDIEDIL
jgi:hypothetical protein